MNFEEISISKTPVRKTCRSVDIIDCYFVMPVVGKKETIKKEKKKSENIFSWGRIRLNHTRTHRAGLLKLW